MFKLSKVESLVAVVAILVVGSIGYLVLNNSHAAVNADVNGNGVVDLIDLSTLLSNYGRTGITSNNLSVGDINGDGTVGLIDLSTLLSNWGVTSGSTQGQMFITTSELMSKPTSGTGWTFLQTQADKANGAVVDLSDQNSFTQTYTLAAALVYARTGNTTYKNYVSTNVAKICGTEQNHTSPDVLPIARTLYGYVVAADLVQMPLNSTCTNGQTLQAFYGGIRDEVIPSNGTWDTLTHTAQRTSANWGSYALSTHLAVSYALNDTAAIQNDTNIFKRILGDASSSAAAFGPSASYRYPNSSLTSTSNGLTWDMVSTVSNAVQVGVNPYSGTDQRSGALIEDALRLTSGGTDSQTCCTVSAAAAGYQEESLDGIFSTAQLLKAHGVDMTIFQSNAMKRAFDFYLAHGTSTFGVKAYLPYVINYWYGASNTTSGDSVYRHMGFGGWLFKGSATACTGVNIAPGASIQAAINANTGATTFCLNGTYNLTTALLPKSGNTFIGPATLDGGNTATVAIDGNNATNVTVKGLLIQRFNNTNLIPALGKNNEGSGWDIENNEVAYNTTEGVFAGAGSTVKNNHIHHNGQLGISGFQANNAVVDGNEVDHNGASQYTTNEGGGIKYYKGTNITTSNNNVHDNIGTGIWLDTDVVSSLVSGNTVSNNADVSNSSYGIEIEITCNVTVSNNTITGTSSQTNGVMLSSSHDVTVSGNSINGTKNGITLWMDNTRSTQTTCGAPSINNNQVTSNTITLASGASHVTGVYLYNGGSGTGTAPTGISFTNNHYHAPDCTAAHWQWYITSNLNYTFSGWQGLGQDSTSSGSTCGP